MTNEPVVRLFGQPTAPKPARRDSELELVQTTGSARANQVLDAVAHGLARDDQETEAGQYLAAYRVRRGRVEEVAPCT